MHKEDERPDAWLIFNETELSLLSTLFVATAGSQWKRTRLINLWECKPYFKQTELCYSWLIFSWLRCHMKEHDSLLKFRYRPPNDFLVSSLQIALNHSCVKYASSELHQMKDEDLSFPNMCHLLIIIVIKLW